MSEPAREDQKGNEKTRELAISMINNEMNRFWTRFNIFGAVQVGAVVGIASSAQFLLANKPILRGVFLLVTAFSISGSIAIFRGFDLQKSLVEALFDLEQSFPEQDRIAGIMGRHQMLPWYTSSITCSLFGLLCSLFWIIGWIWLEVSGFQVTMALLHKAGRR